MGEAEVAIKIGTCGWARLYQSVPPSEREEKSNLQAYALTSGCMGCQATI
jgi:hypothetical protein